jgi:hypothetical protein
MILAIARFSVLVKLVAENEELARVLRPDLAHGACLGDVTFPPAVVAACARAVSSQVPLPAASEALCFVVLLLGTFLFLIIPQR